LKVASLGGVLVSNPVTRNSDSSLICHV